MNKQYKYELPKNMEVESTNVRVENGKLVVDVEFKDKFEPKDGDFVVMGYEAEGGSCYWISIIKDFRKDFDTIRTTDYVTHIFKADGKQTEFLNKIEFNKKTDAAEKIRLATHKEKTALLERLEKEYGKRWNEEKKCLEDIRWKPKDKEMYYFVTLESFVYQVEYDEHFIADIVRVNSNNCFKTREAAQKEADKKKNIFKNSKAEGWGKNVKEYRNTLIGK